MMLSKCTHWLVSGVLGAIAIAASVAAAGDVTITYPDSVTPQQRGAVVKSLMSVVPAGSKVELAAGDNDLADASGTCTRIPAILFKGAGRGKTIIRSRANNQLMCQAELTHGTVVSSMTVNNDCALGSAGVCIGFSQATTASGSSATIEDCEIIGHGEYGVYNWSAANNLIYIDNCEVTSKDGACAGRGSDAQACYLVINKSTITGDISVGRTGGDSGNQVFGVWCRGGRVIAHESKFVSRGTADPFGPNKSVLTRQAAAFVGLGDTRNVGLQTWATFEAFNCTFKVESFPTCVQADVIEELTRQPNSVVLTGGTGSAKDGSIVSIGNVAKLKATK